MKYLTFDCTFKQSQSRQVMLTNYIFLNSFTDFGTSAQLSELNLLWVLRSIQFQKLAQDVRIAQDHIRSPDFPHLTNVGLNKTRLTVYILDVQSEG